MDNYIQVEDGEEPYYLPVESNNTLPLETLQSALGVAADYVFMLKTNVSS